MHTDLEIENVIVIIWRCLQSGDNYTSLFQDYF